MKSEEWRVEREELGVKREEGRVKREEGEVKKIKSFRLVQIVFYS